MTGDRSLLNLPNVLTMSRFALIPVFIVIFSKGYIEIAFLIVLLAGLTDILDGHIARRSGQITQLGIMLDPLADKCMLLVVFISLLYVNLIPWQTAIAISIREIGMITWSAFSYVRKKKTVPANMMGKVTTVLYYVALGFIVYDVSYDIYFLWFVIAISFLTSLIYILKAKKNMFTVG